MLQSNDDIIEDEVRKVLYEPRQEFLPFHLRDQRFACIVVHRRGGKTVACINELITRAIYTSKKDARFAYIAPLRNQAKDLAWTYLKRYTEGLVNKPSETELSVTFKHNGARIRLYGADNPDSFRGIYLDGVVIDEYGDMSPIIWGTILNPTLMDRKGWAVFIGTFKGRNHFWKTYERACGRLLGPNENPEYFKKNWYSFILPASKSKIYTAEEFEAMRMELDEEEYQQEYECNPDAAVKGTYYSKLISELTQRAQVYDNEIAEWDPLLPVLIFADLGRSDSTALWFVQRRPGCYAIIDYLEEHGKGLDFYADAVSDKPYAYEAWYVPHDAKAKTLATKRSTIEQLIDYDEAGKFKRFDQSVPLLRLGPKLDVQHGIDAVRKILPDCYFHSRTEAGVEALRAYRRRWDDIKKTFADDPAHDWASHGSDAFRYLALGVQDFMPKKIEDPEANKPKPAQLTLELLWADRARGQRMRSRL